MYKKFDINSLNKTLRKIPYWKQLAFLLSVCERMLYSFEYFSKKFNYNHNNELNTALEKAWFHLLKGEVNVDLFVHQKACENIAPDTEEYDTVWVSSALDVAVAISLLMKAFSVHETNIICEATSLVIDTIDMQVQEIDKINPLDTQIEEKILSHFLMQRELMKQDEDINFLQRIDNKIESSIFKVKEEWTKTNFSCLRS